MSEGEADFDVIVLGAGSAGENVAGVAAKAGLEVAIVESDLVGGECTYWACMPSKALLRPGDVADAASRAPGFIGGAVDVDEALARRDALAAHWDDEAQVSWLDEAGVRLIRGRGRLAGDRTVEVDTPDGATRRYTASRAVVVATGSSPAMPPIEGLEKAEPWDNRDATSAREVPRRLVIIGGGAVGAELAQAWKTLGADEVTLIELFDRILAVEEPFAGAEVQESLEARGIRVLTEAKTERVERDGRDGPVTVDVTLGDESRTSIEADEVLVATGRRPNTDDIGLESIGLEPGESIDVDDHLRATGVEGGWLYAVGDVNGRSLLTHTGKYQARIAGAHIGGLDSRAWGDRTAIPRVVFTAPQVAAVGLTESTARERGIPVRTVQHDIGKVAGASTLGRGYHGTAKLVVDADRGVIVGATFVGPHVGELLHAATVAVAAEVSLATLWHAVPAFPTLSEVWLRLLESYRDEHGVEFV